MRNLEFTAEDDTKSAAFVINYAKHLAVTLGHNYVGTEHLTAILTFEPNAAAMLKTFGEYIPKNILRGLGMLISQGNAGIVSVDQLQITPLLRRSISLAIRERQVFGEEIDDIDSLDLLVGISREGSSISAGILETCGVNPGKLVNLVREKRLSDARLKLITILEQKFSCSPDQTQKLNS